MIRLYHKHKEILHIGLPWIVLFLALNIPFYEDGDVNAYSRYAAMRAMSMEGTFQIDNMVHWTMDWAKAPNGHYYSNKAPGPMLISYPVFWLLDKFKQVTSEGFMSNYKDKWTVGFEHKVAIPLIFQMIPFCLLVLFIINILKENNVSEVAITFTAIAILFGNTASLMMTTWFGHGFSAWLILAIFVSLYYQRYMLLGLFSGTAILSDYSIVLFLPGILIYVLYKSEFSFSFIRKTALGTVIPVLLWVWYHWVCFGNPFLIPNMFQNPQFGASDLGGQFHLLPQLTILRKLIFGDERGILYTQPWVLLILITGIYYLTKKSFGKNYKALILLAFVSFALLILMNSAFTGWHGGSTPGPRYLSPVLPLLAVIAGFIYDKSSPLFKHAAWILLGITMIFYGLVYANSILAFEYFTIWTWLLDYLIQGRGSWLRLAIYILSMSAVIVYVFKFRLKASTQDIYS